MNLLKTSSFFYLCIRIIKLYLMCMSIFAPLHIKSGYSFLRSGLTIQKIASAVKKQDYYGAGLTDDALFGAHEFFDSLKEIKKPAILGMEIVLNNDNISLFVLDEDGYRNLIKINYFVQQEKLDLKQLRNYSKGLLAVIETKYGDFRSNFLEFGETPKFTKYLLDISDCFKDNFYLGLEVTSKEDVAYANSIRKFADKFTYKCVAFPRILYVNKEDAIVLDIVNAIKNEEDLEIKSREGQEYFMTEINYKKIYSTTELKNSIEIINASKFDLYQKRGSMLKFTPNDSSEELRNHCYTLSIDWVSKIMNIFLD